MAEVDTRHSQGSKMGVSSLYRVISRLSFTSMGKMKELGNTKVAIEINDVASTKRRPLCRRVL